MLPTDQSILVTDETGLSVDIPTTFASWGVNPWRFGAQKENPFHYLVFQYRNPQTIDLLLSFHKCHALLGQKDNYGNTPFQIAWQGSDSKMIECLNKYIDKIDVALPDAQGLTPLHYAVNGLKKNPTYRDFYLNQINILINHTKDEDLDRDILEFLFTEHFLDLEPLSANSRIKEFVYKYGFAVEEGQEAQIATPALAPLLADTMESASQKSLREMKELFETRWQEALEREAVAQEKLRIENQSAIKIQSIFRGREDRIKIYQPKLEEKRKIQENLAAETALERLRIKEMEKESARKRAEELLRQQELEKLEMEKKKALELEQQKIAEAKKKQDEQDAAAKEVEKIAKQEQIEQKRLEEKLAKAQRVLQKKVEDAAKRAAEAEEIKRIKTEEEGDKKTFMQNVSAGKKDVILGTLTKWVDRKKMDVVNFLLNQRVNFNSTGIQTSNFGFLCLKFPDIAIEILKIKKSKIDFEQKTVCINSKQDIARQTNVFNVAQLALVSENPELFRMVYEAIESGDSLVFKRINFPLMLENLNTSLELFEYRSIHFPDTSREKSKRAAEEVFTFLSAQFPAKETAEATFDYKEDLTPNDLLYTSIQNNDFIKVLSCLSLGANINNLLSYCCPMEGITKHKSPIQIAIDNLDNLFESKSEKEVISAKAMVRMLYFAGASLTEEQKMPVTGRFVNLFARRTLLERSLSPATSVIFGYTMESAKSIITLPLDIPGQTELMLISLSMQPMKTLEDEEMLHLACSKGNLTLIKFLIDFKKFPINQTCKHVTALDVAIAMGHEKIADFLLQRGATINHEKIGVAIENCSEEKSENMRSLIDKHTLMREYARKAANAELKPRTSIAALKSEGLGLEPTFPLKNFLIF